MDLALDRAGRVLTVLRVAGKRQAWTPIRRVRSHACAVGHPRRLDRVLTVLKLRDWAPIRCGRVSTVLGVLAGVLGVLGV